MPVPTDAVVKQIDQVLAAHQQLRRKSEYDDCSDQPEPEVTQLMTLISATVERFAPPGSHYIQAVHNLIKTAGIGNAYSLPHLAGILGALREAFAQGYLQTVAELIHADVFSDFIEMAEYLLSEGYKDPAAVIIGSTLEEHLRQLCAKHGVSTASGGKPKKADTLNAELASAASYTKLDQKSVISWLDLRNKAAHGQYGEYSGEQVVLMLAGVRDFMARNPA